MSKYKPEMLRLILFSKQGTDCTEANTEIRKQGDLTFTLAAFLNILLGFRLSGFPVSSESHGNKLQFISASVEIHR